MTPAQIRIEVSILDCLADLRDVWPHRRTPAIRKHVRRLVYLIRTKRLARDRIGRRTAARWGKR